MKVAQLWRYPVKSMGGEQLDCARIGELGVLGDRTWALREGQHTRGAKKFPALMGMKAWYESSPDSAAPRVQIDTDLILAADDPSLSKTLAATLNAPVTLTPLAPPTDLDFYRRRERRTLEESRAIFGLVDGEPFPDVTGFPPSIAEFATPPGTYFDCFPILIMTTASLAALEAVAGDSVIDVRRFRPNLLLDADDSGFIEQSWRGKTLEIGPVTLRLTMPCPRCVMTTIGFDDLPRDTSIMRTLVRECRHELGIYAEVVSGGDIFTGDKAVLID